jgi:hypothetical protein
VCALTVRISYVEKCSRRFAVTDGGVTQIFDARHTNYREVAERAPLAHVDPLAALGRKTTQRSWEDSESCRHNVCKAAAHPGFAESLLLHPLPGRKIGLPQGGAGAFK